MIVGDVGERGGVDGLLGRAGLRAEILEPGSSRSRAWQQNRHGHGED